MIPKNIILTSLFLLGATLYARAQQLVEVTPTFRFEDGVYLSYDSFQKNQPDLPWSALVRRSITNPETLMTQVEYIKVKESREDLSLENVWGICVDGLPHIRIPEDSIHKKLSTFVGLRVAGNINYFSYENRIEKEYDFAAYNPINGEPFRRAKVKRPVTVFVEKVMDFESGQVFSFGKKALESLMVNDPQLLEVMAELDSNDEDYEEQLFRLLMSYNRRHRVYFKQ